MYLGLDEIGLRFADADVAMHFLDENHYIVTQLSICSGNGLVANRQQAIT